MTYLDLEIERGDTFRRKILVTDEANAAEDITGWTIFFTLKNDPADADAAAVIQKNITSHADPTGGESELLLSAADTDALTNPQYHYDLQIKKVDGDVRTILKGLFFVKTDITRRTA